MCRACLSLVNEAPPLDLGALSFVSHRLSYFHLFPLMFVPTSTAIRYLSGIMTDNGWQFLLPFFLSMFEGVASPNRESPLHQK